MICEHSRILYGPDFEPKCAECWIPASEIHTGRQWFNEVVIFGHLTRYGTAIANEPGWLRDAVEWDSHSVKMRVWINRTMGSYVKNEHEE